MHIHVFGFFLPNIYQIKSCESPCLLGIIKMVNKQFTSCKYLITKYLQDTKTLLTFALSKQKKSHFKKGNYVKKKRIN